MTLDIADPGQLRNYLIETGLVATANNFHIEKLGGGVSCNTFRVICPGQAAFVIKQALPRLKVASRWLSSPGRAHREALGIPCLQQLLSEESVPSLLVEDEHNHILVIEALASPHDNWKHLLLDGHLSEDHASQFGLMLTAIHSGAFQRAPELEPIFQDTSFFEALRMEAYYDYTAHQVAAAKQFIESLLNETRLQRTTLVHGDYSPKNVLIRQGKLHLLDHETLHWGDPMFDIGFSLTHFLSKANHLPDRRDDFLRLAQVYWRAYHQDGSPAFWSDDCEPRAVRHTLACLLARVHGRSPLEYLDEPARQRQTARVLNLLKNPPKRVSDLLTDFTLNL